MSGWVENQPEEVQEGRTARWEEAQSLLVEPQLASNLRYDLGQAS